MPILEQTAHAIRSSDEARRRCFVREGRRRFRVLLAWDALMPLLANHHLSRRRGRLVRPELLHCDAMLERNSRYRQSSSSPGSNTLSNIDIVFLSYLQICASNRALSFVDCYGIVTGHSSELLRVDARSSWSQALSNTRCNSATYLEDRMDVLIQREAPDRLIQAIVGIQHQVSLQHCQSLHFASILAHRALKPGLQL